MSNLSLFNSLFYNDKSLKLIYYKLIDTGANPLSACKSQTQLAPLKNKSPAYCNMFAANTYQREHFLFALHTAGGGGGGRGEYFSNMG